MEDKDGVYFLFHIKYIVLFIIYFIFKNEPLLHFEGQSIPVISPIQRSNK